nr:SHOCT domain-containing protein [Propionicimonas sp.]
MTDRIPDFFLNLGSVLWYTLTIIIFISYLFALFAIIGDLFRDRELSGGWKAVWIFFLVFFPFITALVYLIARGGGMAQRAEAQVKQSKAATDEYIRSVAGSPSDEIARAKALLDAGTISAEEYATLKAKALS